MPLFNKYLLNTCYGLHVFVSQIFNETQMPNVMLSGDGALRGH